MRRPVGMPLGMMRKKLSVALIFNSILCAGLVTLLFGGLI